MGHIHGATRPEAIQVPQRRDDSITDDNPGRFIAAVVAALALEGQGLRHVVAAATGRPRDHPGDLLTLDLDGSLYR